MSRRPLATVRPAALATLLGLLLSAQALAQSSSQSVTDPSASVVTSRVPAEQVLLQALAAHPITAPYHFAAKPKGDRIELSGRVGSKYVHDVAVRIAIDAGIPILDSLVIDTTATPVAVAPLPGPVVPPVGPVASYVYPPPLFGAVDDPFYGFEPPVISYPPWWPALSARRLGESAAAAAAYLPPATETATPDLPAPSSGTVEMTIDPLGFARLRGTVSTPEEKLAIGQRAARMPGIAGVINDLTIAPPATGMEPAIDPQRAAPSETPPPPPTPVERSAPSMAEPPPPPPPPTGPLRLPPDSTPSSNDRDEASRTDEPGLADQLAEALAAHPELAALAIESDVRDGVATLRGRVPTAYEAMLAWRTAEQWPGIRAVRDGLRFPVPAPGDPSPLLERGRIEDVQHYLVAQLRRHLEGQAQVDRVVLRGKTLEVHGLIPREADRPRIEAVLRSTALLRGFRVEPRFQAGRRYEDYLDFNGPGPTDGPENATELSNLRQNWP